MSLWTPYVNDVALDLSKSATNRVTPEPREYPSYPYQFSAAPFGFQHQYPVFVPSSQMSPVSAGSTCSYDAGPFTRPGGLSPMDNLPRELSPVTAFPRPDSPPDSPETKRRCSYMLDADTLAGDPNYQAFERNALKVMAEKNGGTLLGNNPRMRRVVRSTNDNADDEYRRQRERNNFAAKQSRDRRKLREVKLALKVAYLKNEVANLRATLNAGVCSQCRTSQSL